MKAVFYIPQEPSQAAENLKCSLVCQFSGLTTTQGVGEWFNSSGELVQEPVYILTVLAAVDVYRDTLARLARQYLREGNQECVLYEIDGMPYFVYANEEN